MLDREELLTQFHYCPDTGVFTRIAVRDCHSNLKSTNYVIDGGKANRYKRVSINGKRYLLHKLVFLYLENYYPESEVDHIDGNTLNNKRSNLRDVGKQENRLNLKKYKSNTTGITGVGLKNGKYYAQCQHKKKTYFKGYFDTIEEAVDARKQMDVELGFHNNHGSER